MTTIAYDRPVKDLVAQLSATGHVTHTAYRKTSVTLHHNGGRLSHEGVLNVWKTRKASAQFDSDAVGALAQFVKVNEYAWACGNTAGNMGSIHIEMANSTTAPTWKVADATWKSAARLAGWLFAKVIGVRPSSSNFFMHSHWFATECAGPYIKSVFAQIMVEAQKAYDSFKGGKVPAQPPHPPVTPPRPSSGKIVLAVDGDFGLQSRRRFQQWAGAAVDGVLGSLSWKAIQRKFGGLVVDGSPGHNTWTRIQQVTGAGVDGVPGPDTYRHLQAYLNAH